MSESQTVPETLFEFQDRFATEEACEDYLIAWRWPEGFRCPRCDCADGVRLRYRRQIQCRACKYQASATAGTALHKSKVGLKKWFWAIFLVARHKKSISALQLQRDLGIGSYRTAWLMLQKIRSCFGEGGNFPLKGLVEVDETLVGAKRRGDPNHKDPGHKAIVIGAVQLGDETARGHRWCGIRLRRIPDFNKSSIGPFVIDFIANGSHLLTDGWQAYAHLEKTGYTRSQTVSRKLDRNRLFEINPMPHIHLLFSNLKTWLRGRFHGVSNKYLPLYLDEFAYRVNRRHDPPAIFGWIVRRIVRAPHSPLSILMASESSA